MKAQDKAKTRDISETDISNMPDGEFKAIIIRRIITRLGKRIEEISETLTTWETSTAMNTLSSKGIIQNRWRDKEFHKQTNKQTKEFIIIKPALQEILKGTL